MTKGVAGVAVITAVLWLGVTPVTAADSAPTAGREAAAQSREAPRSSRLRFRSGPVCMCIEGLSEAEIEAAERKRLESIVPQQDDERR